MLDKRDTLFFYSRTNPFFEFSPFYHSPFEIGGVRYRTVIHYFYTAMITDESIKDYIRCAGTPLLAIRYFKELVNTKPEIINKDYEDIKDSVMFRGLKAKFSQNIELKMLLLSTGTKILCEKSDDMYWGYKGENRLGKLLMKLRDELD